MVDKETAAAIESELLSMPEEIEKKAGEKLEALEEYRKAEAEIEKEQARITQTEKAKILAEVDSQIEKIMVMPKVDADKRLRVLKMHMPTIEDLKAIAIQETYQKRLEVITKESTWRARTKEFDKLRDKFEALKERSYNYRQEMKSLRG